MEPVAHSQKGHPIFGFDGPNETRPIFGYHPEKGVPVCASPKRKGKGNCLIQQRQGNGRCKKHGGMALKGPDSPRFKHGLDSQYVLPESLLNDYERQEHDDELIQHRNTVKLTDAIINDVLKEYD